jgi:hypothetical protein
VAVLGEAMVLLEATVVNVALPAIGRDLGGGVAGLQWTRYCFLVKVSAFFSLRFLAILAAIRRPMARFS